MRIRPLPLAVAWRYLCSPKTHGAVSAISIISVVGVAVATAAIIIVLSVFNGFRTQLNLRLDSLTTDVSVLPAEGKTIQDGDSLANVLSLLKNVATAMPMISENALAIAESKEMPVTLMGVLPEDFSEITAIDSLIIDGEPFRDFSPRDASVAVGVAQRFGIHQSGTDMLVFAPKRIGRINTANPFSSFTTDSLKIVSVFRAMQSEFDENTVICDIEVARKLFQYEHESTSIEIKGVSGTDPTLLAREISEFLGDSFVVKDRLQQQEINFRMVAVEKWITFLFLAFILLIASFNIISTLSMLIVEKERSLKTLSDIGWSKSKIGQVFWWESILVTFAGAIAGIILGIGLSLLQQEFGLIRLAGDPQSLVIQVYPVKVEALDILITLVPVVTIGLITAWISAGFARRQASF